MLHHASFSLHEPEKAAVILAEMLGATVLRAPSPPFPPDSWFVCYGDAAGSFLELLPWGSVLDPESRFGIAEDPGMRPRSGAHVLVSTPRSLEQIQELAARASWPLQVVDARLFKVVKIWVEGAILVELLPPEFAPLYQSTFGPVGLLSLDARLRALESGVKS